MIGLDTSFLVGLAIRERTHSSCHALFRDEIVGGTASLALAPQVLAEFCHVVTDPRRFESPLDLATAIGMSEQWWEALEVRQVLPDSEAAPAVPRLDERVRARSQAASRCGARRHLPPGRDRARGNQ